MPPFGCVSVGHGLASLRDGVELNLLAAPKAGARRVAAVVRLLVRSPEGHIGPPLCPFELAMDLLGRSVALWKVSATTSGTGAEIVIGRSILS